MDERQWIHAIQNGDKQYLQDIAEKYYDDIFRFCAFQTGNRDDAYDLAQETFLRFIRYVERYRHGNLKGYLLTIAMNVCRQYGGHRAKKGTEIPFSEFFDGADTVESVERCGAAGNKDWMGHGEFLPEQKALEADIHRNLMRALGELPDMQREAILLYYLYNMKYREISKMTEVSVSTVKSRVRQGINKLQDNLRKEDFLD